MEILKKIVKKRKWFLLVCLFMGIVAFSNPVNAASKSSKAKKAYSSFYRNLPEETKRRYSKKLCDINQDGVPEMILSYDGSPDGVRGELYGYEIYTYIKGKVKCMKKRSIDWGCWNLYYSKSKKRLALYEQRGDLWMGCTVYKIKNGKLKQMVCYKAVNGMKLTYYKNKKRISEDKFRKNYEFYEKNWKKIY